MSASHPRYELLRKRLDVFTSVLHRVEEGDVRALHRTRVASRRLREVLPILQVDPATTRKLVRRLRRVTDRLGSVRELDVLLLLLEELHESGRQDDAGLKRVVAVVSEERNEARKRLYEKLPTAELRRLANRLTEVSRELESARSDRRKDLAWRWAVDARIARRAQRLATAMGEAGAVYLPERLHVVRISLKKLRYAVELRAEIAGEKRSDDLRTLKRAQDLLGRMHDRQMLIGRVRQVQAALTPPDSAAWDALDTVINSLEDDCRHLHARYMRMRPALAAVCGQSIARPSTTSARRGQAAPRRAAS